MEFEARARAGILLTKPNGRCRRRIAPTLLTAEAMRLIYGALLRRIVKSNYRVLDRRLSLSAPHKLFLVGRAWASGRLQACRET